MAMHKNYGHLLRCRWTETVLGRLGAFLPMFVRRITKEKRWRQAASSDTLLCPRYATGQKQVAKNQSQ